MPPGGKNGTEQRKSHAPWGIFALLLFNALTVYFLYTDFRQVEDLGSVPVDLMQLVFTLVGLMLIGVGNIAPKLRKNSVIGFRVPWSMKSERAWKKCQRFSGLVSILTGVLMIAAASLQGLCLHGPQPWDPAYPPAGGAFLCLAGGQKRKKRSGGGMTLQKKPPSPRGKAVLFL